MTLRLPLWASLFTLAGLVLLLFLGFWQVERLAWKRDLLNQLDAASRAEITSFSNFEDIVEAAPFTRVRVRGRYDHDAEMLITPRTWEGKIGYHLVTPLELEQGGRLLINRGWIPVDKKDPNSRPETRQPGTIDITGLLRSAEKPGLFTPPNTPETNSWYYIDPTLLNHAGQPASQNILYADQGTVSNALPVTEALRWQPPNNHLSYAVFWFLMAGVLLTIYYIRFIHPQFKSPAQ